MFGLQIKMSYHVLSCPIDQKQEIVFNIKVPFEIVPEDKEKIKKQAVLFQTGPCIWILRGRISDSFLQSGHLPPRV
ncbi:MAG: hypothetical protein A3B72_09275 [Omnitrophica bacterium RIFCSPHIGHO2_02_FULL_45_28]|nr:MAG: hypothetical protein A3B72_09275 [Omnitrophica bacterium RIFCSPHIGHO2_02_FULL_45_28]